VACVAKLTTLKAILMYCPHNAIVNCGQIMFEGQDVFKMSDDELSTMRRTGVGMIFQDPSSALNPVFSIGKQFLIALKYSKPRDTSPKELI
jgi:peptide/nickel transport system ATP-binding protein